MIKVEHATDAGGSNGEIFLICDNGSGYLANYLIETNDFGPMCPCCMFDRNWKAIMKTVQNMIDSGIISGKIKWCSHKSYAPHYGNNVEEHSRGNLQQKYFYGGDANEMSSEAKEELKKIALQRRKSAES